MRSSPSEPGPFARPCSRTRQADPVKIASNGIRVNVDEKGSGDPALVFLHYWGGSTRTWHRVTAALMRSYRTIATDHRGWGESDAPVEGYALADLADDAAGVIGALDLKRYVLVGHSMGGKVAQLLASRRPPGLVGLVLVASAPPSPLALSAQAREMMAGAYASRETVEATIDRVLAARPLSPSDREQVIADSLRAAPQAKQAWPAVTGQEDIHDAVAAIEVPTLIIAGALDRVDTVESIRAELLPRVPGAALQVLPGTGHLSPLEAPAELAGLIDRFAAGLA